MTLSFTKPYFLLLIPVFLFFIFYSAKKGTFQNKFQRNFLSAVRSIVCIVLIVSLSGMSIRQYVDTTTTIFAVDLSASAKNSADKMLEFLQEAQKTKKTNDKAGIICFGEKAVVELSPQKEFTASDFRSYINEEETNIADGLKLSSIIVPEDTKKRIVLLSDGNENAGEALTTAKLLKNQNFNIDVYPVESQYREEVQLTELKVAEFLNKDVQYDIELKIDSTIATTSNVKLYKQNVLIANETIEVRSGENSIIFPDVSDIGGSILYRAEILPQKDNLKENNAAYAYSYVDDIPSVLLVQENESGRELKKILEQSQVAVTETQAASVPVSMEQLSIYDAVLLTDISASLLPKGFLDSLESYVKNLGGGLFVSGGENAYALGEYYKTPLETILPVDMELDTNSQMPNLGMVLVIDRSGSMMSGQYGISPISMAKEAAIRSLDDLKETDQLGVVTFDDKPSWTVNLQQIGGNQQSIKESIGSIQAGGGTSILPALHVAYDSLKNADTKLKHIILLTDGQAEQEGYDGLLENMKSYGITLSTIAVGSAADTKLMERLAKGGKGRYYFTNEFTDLPEVFAKETFLAGKKYINNRTFFPSQGDSSAILTGIDSVPQLDGYIGTTAKPRADVVLKSDKDDPVLASWQYGLGRSAAWTSDIKGNWTQKWLTSQEGVAVIRNTIAWVMRKQASRDIHITGERKGEKSNIIVQMPYDDTIKEMKGSVISSDNQQYEVNFSSVAPGVYEGTIDTKEEGAYVVNLELERKEGEKEVLHSGLNLPYSQEYNIKKAANGINLLHRLADTTQGRVLSSAKEVFADDTMEVYTDKDMGSIFMILALVLFLLDIALRRFSFLLAGVETRFYKMTSAFSIKGHGVRQKKHLSSVKSVPTQNTGDSTVKEQKNTRVKEENDSGQKKSTAALLAEKRRKRDKK